MSCLIKLFLVLSNSAAAVSLQAHAVIQSVRSFSLSDCNVASSLLSDELKAEEDHFGELWFGELCILGKKERCLNWRHHHDLSKGLFCRQISLLRQTDRKETFLYLALFPLRNTPSFSLFVKVLFEYYLGKLTIKSCGRHRLDVY